jgi:hypothetical protein
VKIGDCVYIVSDCLTVGGGIPGVVTALHETTADVQTSLRSQVLTVATIDLLPARLYTQAILRAVFDAFNFIEREDGSVLNLKRCELADKLFKQGLNRRTALQCANFFDATEWKVSKFPFYRLVKRIRNYYYREDRRSIFELARLSEQTPDPIGSGYTPQAPRRNREFAVRTGRSFSFNR